MACGTENEGQENEEQVNMPRRRQVRRVDKSICQKCQSQKSLYIIRNSTFCKPCFEHAMFARFSKTLHPPLKSATSAHKSVSSSGYRPPPQSGSALVSLSSGCGSTTLLDLLLSRRYIGKGDVRPVDKTKGEKEPIWKKGWVVYVEFAGVLQGVDERMDEVKNWVEEKELTFIGVKAEEVFDAGLKNRLRALAGLPTQPETIEQIAPGFEANLNNTSLPLYPIAESSSSPSSPSYPGTPLDRLKTLVSSLPPPSRPQFLSHILSSIVTLVAHTIPNISHVLLGETSTRQAQRLIAGTALGRGWQLPLELSPVRTEPSLPGMEGGGFMWLKPMKDITTKEAAIYCHLKGLDHWTRNERRWESGIGKSARGKVGSLEQLTEEFIAGLSVTHPSTVSTINRTGDKLVFPGKEEDRPFCPVCQLPVDPSALEWKSRTALTSLPNKINPISDAAISSNAESAADLASLLCYSCLTTFTPSTVVSKTNNVEGGNVSLPSWIGEGVRRREMGRDEMRDRIGKYIIDE